MSFRNRSVLFTAAIGLHMGSAFAQTASATAPPVPAPSSPPSAAPAQPAAAAVAPVAPAPVAPASDTDASDVAAAPADDAEEPVGSPRALEAENTMNGVTGLLRTISADSGAAGTFRFSVLGSYYTGSGFLCGLCSTATGQVLQKKDDQVRQIGTRIGLSATPVDFLEAYASMRFQSTSDNLGDPTSIEIVGDTTLGLKAFMPAKPDRILSFGGGADLLFLSNPGGVGLDAASVGLHALGTADFTRQKKEARVPIRLHLNAGYEFDGSGNLADSIEQSRANTLGDRPRITRIERFGHDINRVDNFNIALGVEGAFPWVRPFAEWSIDLPVNRQGYDCGNSTNRTAGDGCLANAGFSAMPSRLTIGARIFPWLSDWMNGLAFLAAVDVGTGATSNFVEEVAPELPWAIHIGVAYAADTAPRAKATVVEKVVEVPAAAPVEHYIEGTITRPNKGEPVPDAIVHYVGRSYTGMVTDEQGLFRTRDLAPGDYHFTVSSPDSKDTDCAATIPPDAPPQPAAPARPGVPAAPLPPPPATPLPVVVRVTCELEALPRTATITGVLRDGETTAPVENGTVTITDPLGRQLSLKTDADGAFRFGNVQAGTSKITAVADGYLHAATQVTLEPRKDVSTDISIYKKPVLSNVVVTKKELKLKKEVHFLHGSAEVLPDSMAILEEAADVINEHPELGTIEIQGHTDDTGTPEGNLTLSADRANAVRDVFVANGVDPGRLTTHGYGQEKPLVPNTSAKNRAKNRRVQLVIVK